MVKNHSHKLHLNTAYYGGIFLLLPHYFICVTPFVTPVTCVTYVVTPFVTPLVTPKNVAFPMVLPLLPLLPLNRERKIKSIK